MHYDTLLRLKVARHTLSLASGGAADVPGATGTRAASYTIISRGTDDARALNVACARAYAGTRAREGAWGCARRRFAADILRAHAGPRCGLWRGSGARAPRNGFCSTTLSRGFGWTCADGIERKAQPRRLTVRQPSGGSCFPIDTCWRPARAQCSLLAALCAPPRRPSRSGARRAPRKRCVNMGFRWVHTEHPSGPHLSSQPVAGDERPNGCGGVLVQHGRGRQTSTRA